MVNDYCQRKVELEAISEVRLSSPEIVEQCMKSAGLSMEKFVIGKLKLVSTSLEVNGFQTDLLNSFIGGRGPSFIRASLVIQLTLKMEDISELAPEGKQAKAILASLRQRIGQ